MRKALLTLSLLTTLSLSAQEPGESAALAAQSAKNSDFQGWVFAGVALAVTAAGVLVIAFDEGAAVH